MTLLSLAKGGDGGGGKGIIIININLCVEGLENVEVWCLVADYCCESTSLCALLLSFQSFFFFEGRRIRQ